VSAAESSVATGICTALRQSKTSVTVQLLLGGRVFAIASA
jgi:hypothetical protein